MILGIHHVTAIVGDPHENVQFYQNILGLRLVKKTVNFDDPSVYHLYFGDGLGRPGTIYTSFPYGKALPGRRGTGETHSITFAIPSDALPFWQDRLTQFEVGFEAHELFGRPILRFTDPDGMIVELEENEASDQPVEWNAMPVEPKFAIRRIMRLTLMPADFGGFGRFATTEQAGLELFGWTAIGTKGERQRFQVGDAEIDVLRTDEKVPARPSAGTIHHVAFRNANDDVQVEWRQKLVQEAFHVSPVMDRSYFQSIYFREPGGVLFEFATDAPGMVIDESFETLGTTLRLPSLYEPMRERIERRLPTIESGVIA